MDKNKIGTIVIFVIAAIIFLGSFLYFFRGDVAPGAMWIAISLVIAFVGYKRLK